jgi:flavodoxin
MNVTVLYESFFGNTKQIALAMGNTRHKNIAVYHFGEFSLDQLSETDFLVVGSPTRGFRPCEQTKKFLKDLPAQSLKGKKVAAFDTRIFLDSVSSKSLKFIVKTGGYAAKHIAKALVKKGGELVIPPEGFYVTDEKGPLLEGEVERATKWAESLLTIG